MTDATPIADPQTGEISEPEQDEAQVRSFATLLQQMRYGQMAVEASAALAELISAVEETGKGGEIAVRFKIKPQGQGKQDRRTLQISDDISVKLPEPPRESNIFYATDEHGLSRTDPRQQALNLQEVPKPPVRDIPTPGGQA